MHLIYRLVTSAKRREAKISFGGNLLLNIFKSYVYDIYNNHKWWCLIQWRQHRSILSSDHSQGNFVSCNHAIHISLPDSLCRHGERDHYKISRCRALLWCSEIIFHIWPSSSATCSAIWTVKSLLYLNWVAATNN